MLEHGNYFFVDTSALCQLIRLASPQLRASLQARHRDGSLVAIKGLTVQATSSWGQLEMLEQEAAMLRSMSHPGIPSCLSTFQCDVDGSEGFFIVQASAMAVEVHCWYLLLDHCMHIACMAVLTGSSNLTDLTVIIFAEAGQRPQLTTDVGCWLQAC